MRDIELLQNHRSGDESAFAEIVRRNLSWIYGAARRRLGDAHLAEDVVQAVFVLLDRKGPVFAADAAMACWLHRTTRYACEAAARTERRRAAREQKAAMMRPEAIDPSIDHDWQELAPMLDELIDRLSRGDREAIVLRYFKEMTIAEVAAELGLSPEAARKRIDRALERLRGWAQRRGNPISAQTLTTGLAGLVRPTPPVGLIATATTAATAPAGSALGTTSAAIVKGAGIAMASTKITAAALVAVICVALGGAVCATVWMASSGGEGAVSNTAAPSQAPATLAAAGTAASPPTTPGQMFLTSAASLKVYSRIAPYNGIRWHGNEPQVLFRGEWYRLISIDDVTPEQITAFQKSSGDSAIHKHFAEDLVELLTRMGHAPSNKVVLNLHTLNGHGDVVASNVTMTEENRRELMNWPADGQNSLFAGYRMQDSQPQVQENGTWYDLLAIDGTPVEKLYDEARQKYGDDWKNHNSMEILSGIGRAPGAEAQLDLLTLDTHERVTVSVHAPVLKR
jgi:RNA polymerase sigma factor (sigma-70 family)